MFRVIGLALLAAIAASVISGGNTVVIEIVFLGVIAFIVFLLATNRARLRCTYCGKRVKLGYATCHHCGRTVAEPRPLKGAATTPSAASPAAPEWTPERQRAIDEVFGASARPTAKTAVADAPRPPVDVNHPFWLTGGLYSSVAGESHYQGALRVTEERSCQAGHTHERHFDAFLVKEPDNPVDPEAVAIYSTMGKIGYAPRGSGWWEVLCAIESRSLGDCASCGAHLTGGEGHKLYLGAVLHADPEEELRRLARL